MVFLRRLQICTVAINRRPGSTDAEGFPVSGSSGSGPERTASLVLPDSPVREGAVSGAGASNFDASLAPAASHTLLTRSWPLCVPTLQGHRQAATRWLSAHGTALPMQRRPLPPTPMRRMACRASATLARHRTGWTARWIWNTKLTAEALSLWQIRSRNHPHPTPMPCRYGPLDPCQQLEAPD